MSQYFGDPEGTNGPVLVSARSFSLFSHSWLHDSPRGLMKWALVILIVHFP